MHAATAIGEGLTAIGEGATVAGECLTAIGDGLTVPGEGATAIGEGATVTGECLTAIGDGLTVPGVATAIGEGSTAEAEVRILDIESRKEDSLELNSETVALAISIPSSPASSRTAWRVSYFTVLTLPLPNLTFTFKKSRISTTTAGVINFF